MNEILNPTITCLVLTLLLVPFFIVVAVLFPQRVAKIHDVLHLMPGRAFAVGLVNGVFFLAVGMVLLIIADRIEEGLLKAIFTVPALLVLSVLAIMLSFGLAGLVHLIGERAAPTWGQGRQVLLGTVLLGVGCTVPLVGWFLLLPYASFLGIGAFITSFFQPNKPPLPKE